MADVRLAAAMAILEESGELHKAISAWDAIKSGSDSDIAIDEQYEAANRIIADKFGWVVANQIWDLYCKCGKNCSVKSIKEKLAELNGEVEVGTHGSLCGERR